MVDENNARSALPRPAPFPRSGRGALVLAVVVLCESGSAVEGSPVRQSLLLALAVAVPCAAGGYVLGSWRRDCARSSGPSAGVASGQPAATLISRIEHNAAR